MEKIKAPINNIIKAARDKFLFLSSIWAVWVLRAKLWIMVHNADTEKKITFWKNLWLIQKAGSKLSAIFYP